MLKEMERILRGYCKKNNIDIYDFKTFDNKYFLGHQARTSAGNISCYKSDNNINHRNIKRYYLEVEHKKILKKNW